MNLFHSLGTTSWTRVSIIVAAALAFWLGLISIIPEKYHHVGVVILGAIQTAVTLMMKSGQAPPEEPKP